MDDPTITNGTGGANSYITLSSLPRDIQIEILQFLTGKDLLSMCCVDWYWNAIASDDENIWRPLCRKRWTQIHVDLFKTWKSIWMSRNSRWRFVLHPEQLDTVDISEDGLTICRAQRTKRRYTTVLGDMILKPNTGKYLWFYRVDQSDEFSSFVKFGICTKDFPIKDSLAFSVHGWSYSRGYKWHRSAGERGPHNTIYGTAMNPGDVIGVLFDSDELTLSFIHNNKALGIAFDKTSIPSETEFIPAVTLDTVGDKVTFYIPEVVVV